MVARGSPALFPGTSGMVCSITGSLSRSSRAHELFSRSLRCPRENNIFCLQRPCGHRAAPRDKNDALLLFSHKTGSAPDALISEKRVPGFLMDVTRAQRNSPHLPSLPSITKNAHLPCNGDEVRLQPPRPVTDDFYPMIGVWRRGSVSLYSLHKALFFPVYPWTRASGQRAGTVPGTTCREEAV